MTQTKWKYKKVLYFEWKEYYGFIPIRIGKVLEETDKECLIDIGWFTKIWVFKYDENDIMPAQKESGYCKLLK